MLAEQQPAAASTARGAVVAVAVEVAQVASRRERWVIWVGRKTDVN